MAERDAAPKPDGRRERTKRTRVAIVSALTELLDEGRIEPPAAEIAERAGVALRSIGQHFSSREELLLAVAEHHGSRLEEAQPPPDPGLPFEERVAAFVKERAKVLEASGAMRQAAAVVLARSPAVSEAVRRAAGDRRVASAKLFAREIAESKDPEATDRALSIVTSGRAWDSLRRDMGLTVGAAKTQMTFMLRAVLSR